MAAFFSDVLDEFLTPAFLNGVRKKYHYNPLRQEAEMQTDELLSVAEKMLPLMRAEAFWERNEIRLETFRSESLDASYEKVAMSLGNGLDDLQESYHRKERLSESYMLEVLASEILLKGYEAYNRYMARNTEWHVARYYFPGNGKEFPLEMLPRLLETLTPKIVCNAAFCMLPKKSVAFIAELTKDENISCKGICAGCKNIRCSNRIADEGPFRERMAGTADMPLTYGYSRIFGGGR